MVSAGRSNPAPALPRRTPRYSRQTCMFGKFPEYFWKSNDGAGHTPPKRSVVSARKPLLHRRLHILRRPMPAQQLRQILRKCRSRQHHVAPHLVRLLLQISLHVRQESDDRRPLLQLALQLRNQGQRLHAGKVQIENNQRRLLFPVLFHPLHEILVRLHELNFHVELARCFLDLRHEEQIFDKHKDARVRVSIRRQRFRFRLRILHRKPRPLPSALVPIVVAPGQCRPVAVIHRRRVDAVFVFPAQARPGLLSALIVGTASAPPSSSSTTTGGSSWSCVHSPLKLLRTCCRILQISKAPPVARSRYSRRSSAWHTQSDLRSCGWRLDTLWNEPQLLKRTAIRE